MKITDISVTKKGRYALFVDGEDVNISARSLGAVNVQVVMEKLGGGGHRTIAGAQLPGATVEEAKEKVKGVIDMMLEKGEI